MMRESSEVTYAANVRGPLIASAPRIKSSMLRRSRRDSVFRARPPVSPDRMSAEWRTNDTVGRGSGQGHLSDGVGSSPSRRDTTSAMRRDPSLLRNLSGRVLTPTGVLGIRHLAD